MTDKAAAAIRELAYKHAEPKVTRNSYGEPDISPDVHKINAMLSDLTALISEHYVAKEEVDKMVSERLREELMRYDQWLLANDMGQMFDDTMKCVDEYLKSRESHD